MSVIVGRLTNEYIVALSLIAKHAGTSKARPLKHPKFCAANSFHGGR